MKRLACPHCGVEVYLIATLARGEPKWRMTPIDELPISVRAFNAVRADGNYKTAGDLADARGPESGYDRWHWQESDCSKPARRWRS